MKEYIDKDSLVGAFLEKVYSTTESKIEYGDAINLIQKQPTADVQEVVRCEQCKKHTLKNGSFWCKIHMEPVYGNNFCCWGEKMDKEVSKNA